MVKEIVGKIIRNRVYLLIAIGILLVSFITIGKSYIQNTLSIVGNTKINKNSWIIYFDEIEMSSDSKTALVPADIIDVAKTQIEFGVHLEKPGDIYEFTVYTVNDGTRDAVIDSIEKYELSEAQKKYIDFDVRYDTGEEIKRCDRLYGMESYEKEGLPHKRLIKVTVKFKDDAELNDYPNEDVDLRLFFKINYTYDDLTCPFENEKDYKRLTIRPNGGTYKGRTAETREYLEPGQTITLEEVKRTLYNFVGWSVIIPTENGTYTIDENNFVMGNEDVTIEAEWEEGDYVARIMDTYYPTIQDAFDDVDEKDWEDNTVWLLRDTTEYPENNTADAFTFNLDGHTVTGTITNTSRGKITMVNGRVEAEADHEEAFINYGIMNLGIHDGVVEVDNSIALVGNEYGLVNKKGSKFYFYDGYLEGKTGLIGGYTGKEEQHYVFVNHIAERDCQKVYLVKNPNRAVAKTITNGEHGTTGGDIYYYNLQDGINSVDSNKKLNTELDDTDYILYAIRDFEAAYEIKVEEDSRIFFDLVGYEVQVGKKIINHGYFKINNDKELRTTIKPSMSFENDGELTINNVNIVMTTDSIGIINTNKLDIKNTTVHSKSVYAVDNLTDATITFDTNTELISDTNYGLHNKSSNLVIDHGNIRGFINDDVSGNVEITGDAKFHTYNIPSTNSYIYGIYNNGTIKQTGADVYSQYTVAGLTNRGTYTITDGKISSENVSVDNRDGVLNVEGGDISSPYTTVHYGTVNVRNNAELKSANGPATNNAALNIYSGKVYSEENDTVLYGSVNIYGGELIGADTIAKSIDTFYIEGGKATSEAGGITCSNAIIAGGFVESNDTTITTGSLSMTDGLVKSYEGTGIVVSSSAVMTGGKIVGDIYGLRSNGELTLGENDDDISSTVPEIVGGSFGLYITGPISNFYDGILKGQIDGYNEVVYDGFEKGRITGTPLGATIGEGVDTIDDKEYQTDFIVRLVNWLRVGEEEFNTTNSASEACPENNDCLMTVIRDVYPTFEQTILDENNNKNITFDLNGHKISGTQTIYNESTVTIVDSSESKTGLIEPDRVPVITNTNKMTIKAGTYKADNASSAICNQVGEMTIDNGIFRSSTYGIENSGHLIINNVDMDSTNISIRNVSYYPGYASGSYGSIDMYGGTVKGTNAAIAAYSGTIHIHDGLVEGNKGISGETGTIVVSGGTVHGKTSKALENYYGDIQIHGGEILADNDIAVQTAASTFMDGGHVKGTTGIEHKIMCTGYSCYYNPETIEGGIIEGTVNHGLVGHGSLLTVTGGKIYGEIDGVQNIGSEGRFGTDEGSISTSTPLIQGKRYGLYTNSYMRFYDGILKGKEAAHVGLISQIPDATMIKDDYEFINRERHETQYLVEFGDWLQVGDQTFNSITSACEAIGENGEGTITVIADPYVNFYQEFAKDRKIKFDLNGHSIIMTMTLGNKADLTIVDSKGTGSIHNLRDKTINNSGKMTINGGTYSSEVDYVITNSGELTVNDININSVGGITNGGTLTFNGGSLNGKTDRGLSNTGTATINGGYIHSDTSISVEGNSGVVIVNGGEIANELAEAIRITGGRYCGAIEVHGGEIHGATIGVQGSTQCLLSVDGGHIYSETGIGLRTESADGHITGGVIEGATYGVYSIGTTTLGEDDGTISIDLPIIKGDTYGLYIEQGTLNFYDGILKGATAANYGQITNIPDRSQIFVDEETINDINYETKYLIMETDLAKNLRTGTIYTNLQDSLDEAQEGDTVQLLTNVPLYYAVTNNNTKHFTLDMNGYDISTNKPIVNNGILTITNSNNEEESIIKTSTAMTLFTNTNTLYLEDVTFKNNSSDRYVIRNTNTISMNGTKIDSINGLQTINIATIKDCTFTTTSTTIDNTGEVKIDGGSYTGTYSLYSNSNASSEVKNARFNGTFYNNRGTLRVNNCVISRDNRQSLQNNGTMYIYESEIINDGLFNNAGTLELENSTVNSTGNYIWSSDVSAISNSGNLKVINSEIHFDEDEYPLSVATGIYNTGTVSVEQKSKIHIGLETNDRVTNYGILDTGTGTVIIDDSEIKINGGSTSYGLYSRDGDSHITILTGLVEVNNAKVAYGGYANYGTITMGHYEGVEALSELVSNTNPVVYASGITRGIGIKKVNGQFEFYDGKIWGSRYAKPETTTLVEKLYEATTYVDEETGFEYSVLEFMPDDYQGKPVALFHGIMYPSLQEAIEVYYKYEGEEIKLLKPVSENLEVRLNNKAIVNLNGYSVTGKVVNNGEFQFYNGSIQSFDEEIIDEETGEALPIPPAVINNGTFIMGLDDTKVSSTNTRLIAEGLTIKNNGTFKMYDGYIEGNPTIDGDIQEIASFARIHTVTESQYERKYLQSLDENAIRNKETSLIITVDPVNGFYDNREGEQHYYLYYEDSMEIKIPTKSGCDFVEWIVSDPDAYEKINDPEGKVDGILTVGVKDIKLTASWAVTDRAKAKIGEDYYESLREAIEHAGPNDVVELLKDVEEDITVKKEVKINLGGHKVTGAFINQGILTIYNGEINNPNGTGLINLKTLTMGNLMDGNVEINVVRIIGKELGLQQEGRFNYYDGYIEGEVAMNGIAQSLPQGYSLYTEHNDSTNKQRLFLSGNPENAVASITDGEVTQFFFKLPDAIATAKIVNKEIRIERNFEAPYEINVSEDANIVINMNSHDITTGNNIKVDGELLLYDNSETSGSITSAKSITNNGKLTVKGIKLHQNKAVDTLINNGELIITDNVVDEVSYPAVIEATSQYAIVNNGDLKLLGNFELNSNSYALKQDGTMNDVTTGKIHGVMWYKNTTLKDDVVVTYPLSGRSGDLYVDGISIEATNDSCIYTENMKDSTINIKNVTLTGKNGVFIEGGNNSNNNTVIIENSTINATQYGIRVSSYDTEYNFSNNDVTSTSHAIVVYGRRNDFNVDGNYISTNSHAILDNEYKYEGNRNHWSITGGFIQGLEYGLYMQWVDVETYNVEIKNTVSNRDRYAVFSGGNTWFHFGENTFLNAPNASGFRSESGIIMDETARIFAGANNAYGIWASWLDGPIDGTIITPGTNALGIYTCSNYMNVTFNKVNIESGYIGLYAESSNASYSQNVYFNGGSITGETYGIYINNNLDYIHIGNPDVDLNTMAPEASGGLYGIYNARGRMIFNNGRLRGKTDGYYGEFYGTRDGYDIASTKALIEKNIPVATVSTTEYSDTATTNTPKRGNGHARFTFLDEDTGVCAKNEVYNYEYKGYEESFNVPCTGKYKVEVWGASGGYDTGSYGGLGGYAGGDIQLTAGEKLYINVGGKGQGSISCNDYNGGYNGGGKAGCSGKSGSGGGATHIATRSGLLSTLENHIDDIIIVAGGGGGQGGYTSNYYGAGGGYKGATSSGGGGSQTLAGTGTSGGSFGQGGDRTNGDGGGGGGGFYGGGAAINDGIGGGGSGYIANTRLTNKIMYGWNVPELPLEWNVNFLKNKDDFLEVNGATFNNLKDAIASIGTADTATINVLSNGMNSEDTIFPAGKTITLNLNGKKIKSTRPIKNNGSLIIVDNSTEKTGEINSINDDAFINNHNLTLDGVTVNLTDKYRVITSESGSTGDITINNSKINSADYGIYGSGVFNITITDSEFKTTGEGIRINTKANVVKITNTNITSTISFRIEDTGDNKVTIDKCTFTGSDRGAYLRGYYNEFNFKDSTFKGNSVAGIEFVSYNNNRNTLTMDNCDVTGYQQGILLRSVDSTISNSRISNTIVHRDYYAAYSNAYASSTFDKGTKITSQNGSGIYTNQDITLDNASIDVDTSNGYGIYHSNGALTLKDSSISCEGLSSYGIYSPESTTTTININNSTVESDNIGIHLFGTKTLNVKSGSIDGGVTGIYSNHTAVVTNIGDSEDTLSTENPLITSDNIAIVKNMGTVNFYNGKIVSGSTINTGEFNTVRKDMQIKYEYDYIDGEQVVLSSKDYSIEAISGVPKAGAGYARLTFVENKDTASPSYTELEEVNNSNVVDTFVTEVTPFDYTGDVQSFTAPTTGSYKIELWGAQGGDYRDNTVNGPGNRGGYTSGIIELEKDQTLYVYVGQGLGNGDSKSFNGTTSSTGGGHAGGGATDIRLVKRDTWNDIDSLRSRIMVAGGGGSNDGTDYGGNAGGLIGYSSSRDRWTNTGGSQVSGGVYQRGDACGMGSFGVGSTCGATGGGGYYGGAGANHSDGSGSGGSSFISGHLGSVAVNSATDTSPRKDSSDNVCTAESAKTDITCSYHYSGMKFTNTKMIDGSGYVWTNDVTTEQTGMPTTNDPDKTEMGHRGNGYAKISDLSGKKIVRIVDNYNDYDNEIEYNDGDKLAGLPSKTLDGYEFVGWFLDKGFTKKVTSDTIIHANTYLYAYYRPIGDYCDSLVNQKIDFDYTGGIEKYVIRCKGTYELETWGAQGGYAGSVSLQGGYGGYSRGYVDFDLGEVLYIAVGQEGTPNSKLTSSPIFNGGGLGNNNDANTYAGAGGGATHIALVNGELFRLENSKNDILIVAGGGGGASNHGNNSKSNGGSAGGLVGNDGSSMAWCGGKAGTQTESGASCESGQGVGSFGQGGVGIPNAGGGGGAGWYGGSGGKGGSGGGGSSYVGNTRLKNTFMAGYNTEGSGYRSVTAYLENKDGFLEVNGDVYNSFDSALAALVGKEGTIKVVSDSTITRDSIIPADYNVTLDLNGHVLTLNNPIVNNGTLTITNGIDTIGSIIGTLSPYIVNNKGNLTINKGYYKAGNIAFNGSLADGTITINKDVTIEASTAVYLEVKHTVTINGTKMNVASYGIHNKGNSSTINIKDIDLNSNNIGIRTENHKTNITIDKCNIVTKSYSIQTYGEDNYLLMKDGYITSTTSHVLYNPDGVNTSRRPKFHFEGGKIESPVSVINNNYSSVYLQDVEVKTTGAGNDIYAITSNDWSDVYVDSGAFINAPTASGIYTKSSVKIRGGRVYAGSDNAYGLRSLYLDLEISSGSIETPGNNANAIYCNHNDVTKFSMTGGLVKSGNIAVHLMSSGGERKITITDGTIYGNNYGIYQEQNYNTVIGDSTAESVSTTKPVIEGGLYGIYKTTGSLSFYSGILKGTVGAYYGTFNNIRDNYEIYESVTELNAEELKNRTISTGLVSETATSNTPKLGNGYARITYVSNGDDRIPEIVDNITGATAGISDIVDFKFVNGERKYTVQKSGPYILKVWGAAGGTGKNNSFGGYSEGKVNLTAGTKLYINVGGQGQKYDGGYNGGGKGAAGAGSQWGYGGGGATHIATKSGILSSLEAMKDTVLIVAGGAGGSGGSTPEAYSGSGGGATGGNGWDSVNNSFTSFGGNGASQTAGGKAANGDAAIGIFGKGADFYNLGYGGSGGGGGWYGGGGSSRGHGGAGGGSGYIGNNKLYDKHMTCYNCITDSRTESLTMRSLGTSSEAVTDFAKAGDGYAQIIYVGDEIIEKDSYSIDLVTEYGTLTNNSLVYDANDQLGELPTPTNIPEGLLFLGWYLDSEYTKKVTDSTTVNCDATLYAKYGYDSESCVSMINSKNNFEYTGSEQSIKIKCPGTYKLEVWGAQGGGNTPGTTLGSVGGPGGYSVGTIDLKVGELLYVNVGGAGSYGAGTNTYGGPLGGYNGGGAGGNSSSGSGGGATHIAKESGTLTSLAARKSDILIVAGGGGGADSSTGNTGSSDDGSGGSGGGYIGGDGVVKGKASEKTGGQQTTGASFGLGESVSVNATTGGGGGGYFGGFATNTANGGGGGGSSYIGNNRLNEATMYTYNNKQAYVQKNIAYLIPITDKVINLTTGTKYANIQTALDNAANEDTLELLKDSSIANELTIPNRTITLDLHGFTLTTNKSITNNGTLNIIDLTNSGDSMLVNTVTENFIINNKNMTIDNVDIKGNNIFDNKSAGKLTLKNLDIVQSATAIKNAGELTIKTVNIETTSTGINNTGLIDLDGISINGGTYGIYYKSIGTSTVHNSIINSATAIYTDQNGKLTFDGTYKSTGSVLDYGGTLIINPSSGATLVGNIVVYSGGKASIKNTSISNTVDDWRVYVLVDVYGELTLDSSSVTLNNTTTSNNTNYDCLVRVNGTLRSTSNTFNNSHIDNNRYLYTVMNYSLLYSTSDTFNITDYNIASAYYNETAHSSEIRNVTIDISGSTEPRAVTLQKGDLGISGGRIKLSGTNPRGISQAKDTVAIENVNMTIIGTGNSYVFFNDNGLLKVLSGSYVVEGDNAYGIYNDIGTIEVGVEGNGVSTTDPLIKATGTTTGIGISNVNGTFKYYDGKIMGTTGFKGENDITNGIEDAYQVKSYTEIDSETGIEYKYCILEIMM